MNPLGSIGNFLGSSIGSVGNGLFPNAANAAMPYEQQALNEMPQYYQPYMNAGQAAMGNLQGQYSNLLSNPGAFMNQIGSSYHQSPGFKFALNQALMGANQGAAAGGMAGSPMAQQQNMGIATQMGNQDYYNYLSKALGMYGQGLSGEQGLAGMGFGAASGLGQNIGDILNNQADIAYAGQANQNQQTGGLLGDIMNMFH